MAKTNNSNWVFLPVHKSRIIKNEEKYLLLKIDDNKSTILPKVFKRAKESDTMIYFSLPNDFEINVRVSKYDEFDDTYSYTDKVHKIEQVIGLLKLHTKLD